MNLSEMLGYADIGLLSAIARYYNCECSSHSKHELIQTILSALNRRSTFEHQLREMTEGDLRLMNRLLFDQRHYFSLEELTAIVNQANRVNPETIRSDRIASDKDLNPRETIAKFKQRGWLFNGHSHQTKYLFRVPEDVKRRFRECYTAYLRQQLLYIETPSAYRDEQMIIGQDVLQFLRFVHQNEIALTVDGTMYKRTLQQLLASLHIQEEPVKTRGWRFGYGRKFKDYPNRFSLVYDYCYFNRLIKEQDQLLQLTAEGEARVLNGQKEDPMEIYKLWLKLYKGPIPNLQALVYWIQSLCDRWTSLQSLHATLSQMIQPFYYDDQEQILEQRVVQMMMHLGLLQIGQDPQYGTVVRMNKLGDVIVSGTYVPEEDRIELEAPAEFPL